MKTQETQICTCGHERHYIRGKHKQYVLLGCQTPDCPCKKFEPQKENPEVIILDDNALSVASYAEEYPENWKRIEDALEEPKKQEDGE